MEHHIQPKAEHFFGPEAAAKLRGMVKEIREKNRRKRGVTTEDIKQVESLNDAMDKLSLQPLDEQQLGVLERAAEAAAEGAFIDSVTEAARRDKVLENYLMGLQGKRQARIAKYKAAAAS